MKKIYTQPEIEILVFNEDDIITGSTPVGFKGFEDDGTGYNWPWEN